MGLFSADKIFSMENDFAQWNTGSFGICTAASLAWARKCLSLGRGVKTFSEIGVPVHALNAQMARLRKLDHNPQAQTEMAELEMVEHADHAIISAADLVRHVTITAPFTAIFWTNGHTMGYRYQNKVHEFFDIEDGLYRSKHASYITKKINQNYKNSLAGCRVVRLPA